MNSLLKRYYEFKNNNFHRKNKASLFKKYFVENSINKLQIGCQSQFLSGWLNVDLTPKNREVALLDATIKFPFEAGQLDFIFTEHMIEHITFKDAEFMLSECFRIMKPGGVIRISTPNISFLIDLYIEQKSEVQLAYIEHSKRYIDRKMPLSATSVINNFFKDWGHQYIHDFESLSLLLSNAGFRDIKEVAIGESEHSELVGIESHGNEIGEEFNQLESIVVEATK